MIIEREIGSGPESVYAYYFPSAKKGLSFPHKIGRAKGDPVKRINQQQASMLEEPIIGTLVRCKNSFALEAQLHLQLQDRRLTSTHGSEWFDISPNAISVCLDEGLVELPWYLQLKYHRIVAGLTQTQLAELTGLRQATISDMENNRGDTSISTIQNVCTELHLQWTFAPLKQ